MVAERGARAFWPVWTIALVAAVPFLMRWQDTTAPTTVRLWLIVMGLSLVGALVWGALRFRLPTAQEALDRVDATLPGRPIAAIHDRQAIGADDDASRALWDAHVARMSARSRDAAPVAPNLRLADRDPYGLRLTALLLFAVAFLFAPAPPAEPTDPIVTGGPAQVLAAGPSWEGWIEPPFYTGRPSLYLADQPPGEIEVIAGSRVTIRLYGADHDNRINETVSLPPADGAEPMPEGQFIVARPGRIAVTGDGGAEWTVVLTPDTPPTIAFAGEIETDATGQMAQPFRATDDFAVTGGFATITLDLDRVTRRHGLGPDPMPRDPVVIDLPLPFSGNRTEFEEKLIENFSEHPLSNLPVTITLTARDAADQEGTSEALEMILPGRRFFQPVARAVIEQRRDLLWSHDNAPRVLDLLRAIAYRPEDLFSSRTLYLRLNFINRQLAGVVERGVMTAEEETEIAQALWDLAIQLEDGTLADARARLQRAQERLSEAMRNGASPEEIAELMQELREATDDYLSMLAQDMQPREDDTDQPQSAQDQSREVTQDEIQALMDRIQELMEEGRMAEAEQLMAQLDELLQNLQMTEGQPGQGGPRSPGQQSMEELQDTMREQQELSDDAFRELQDQFNNRQPGQQQQQQQPGQQENPGEGEEQRPGNQPGEQDGQQGQEPGGDEQGNQSGDSADGQDGPGGEQPGSLADRQQGLRQELERQRGELPGLTGEAAERARQLLERAEGAMDRAEQALEQGDLAGAIENQADALNALREGLRNLAEALTRQQGDDTEATEQGEGENTQQAQRTEPARRDPLGRQLGQSGQFGTDQTLLQGEDMRRRATELMQELRRRAGELSRDPTELDYLRRLLDRF